MLNNSTTLELTVAAAQTATASNTCFVVELELTIIVLCAKETVSVPLVTNKSWEDLQEELACSGS